MFQTIAELAAVLPEASFRPSRARRLTAAENYAWHNDSASPFAEFGPCRCEECERWRKQAAA